MVQKATVSAEGRLTADGSPSYAGTGYALALTSSLFAGATTVTGKWNLEAISPMLMASLIFSIATVVMTVVYLPFKRWRTVFSLSRRAWFWLGMFSLSSWLAVWIFWEGVQRIDPSLAAFLNRAEVLVAIFLGMVFLGDRFNRIESLGAALSIAGIVIMHFTLRVEYTAGFWLVLLGSLFFGITEFVSKMAVRYAEPIILAYLRNMFMAVVYWMFLFAYGGSFDGLGKVWPGVVAVGLFGPIFSRTAYLMALRRMELSKVAVISQTQPVFVILIALSVLGQLPTAKEILGGVFLSVGCLVMVTARARKGLPAVSGKTS